MEVPARLSKTTRPLLQLHYDITSPFSYLAFMLSLSPKLDVDIEFVPISLGAVMALSENTPPGANKYKSKWLGQDLVRQARMHSIPIQVLPKCGFPIQTLQVQRVLTVIKQEEEDGDAYINSIHALYNAYWANGLNLSQDKILHEALVRVLGETKLQKYLKQAQSAEIKSKLTQVTRDVVLKHNAFGAPWLVLWQRDSKTFIWSRECFFGSDRWSSVEDCLKDNTNKNCTTSRL